MDLQTALVRLKSKNDFPPGSWLFYQPETGWSSNPYVSFNEVVRQIVQHRQANTRFNLRTDFDSVANELEQYTVARLLSTSGGQDFLVGDPSEGPPLNFPRPRTLAERFGAAAGNVKAGLGVFSDWLGNGLKPVAHELAVQRAAICAVCPQNKPIGNVAETAGVLALRLIEAKNEMELTTPHDDALGMCAACGCANRLKIWANLEHILAHQKPEVSAALDTSCWIHVEQKRSEAVQAA